MSLCSQPLFTATTHSIRIPPTGLSIPQLTSGELDPASSPCIMSEIRLGDNVHQQFVGFIADI